MAAAVNEALVSGTPRGVTRMPDAARLLLPLAILGTLAAQARTLSFYFFQDDYVPFGEIAKNGTWEYLWRLVLGRDLTPNLRVIPGVMYLASYKFFGMTPLPDLEPGRDAADLRPGRSVRAVAADVTQPLHRGVPRR
jgi:hypothetical protein